MKRNLKLVLVIIILICLAAGAGFAVIKKHQYNARIAEEKRLAEEEAKRAEEERALKAKTEEEKSQWYLLLVNSENAIPDDHEITTAVVEDGYEVDERIRDALADMLADCREAGFSPQIISSFRSHEYQEMLYERAVNKADTALPGHSEHECGLAADIIDTGSAGWADPLIDEQQDMPAQKWLMEHCDEYGFILRYPEGKFEKTGIIYEPWHYRYVGKEHASVIMDNGLCLEEYLENMEDYYRPE